MPDFPERSRIEASTSDLFPVDSHVRIEQIQPPRVRVLLERAGQAPKELFQAEIPEVTAPGTALAIRGGFEENGRPFLLGITRCPGKETRVYLVGQVDEKGGIDPGGTGVWVAEEQPREGPPGKYA